MKGKNCGGGKWIWEKKEKKLHLTTLQQQDRRMHGNSLHSNNVFQPMATTVRTDF